MNEDFISVSCISRRQLFILVRNKSVVLLLWMISFMVTLRLWMSYSYIDDDSLIIYKKYCNAKKYRDLIMTLQFKSWMVWWSLGILDLLIHANHASWGEMTKTSHSGKTEWVLIVEYHTLWCVAFMFTFCKVPVLHHFVRFLSFVVPQSWGKSKSLGKLKNLPFTPLWFIYSAFTHAKHASLDEMTKTSHSGKTEFGMIVEYHT